MGEGDSAAAIADAVTGGGVANDGVAGGGAAGSAATGRVGPGGGVASRGVAFGGAAGGALMLGARVTGPGADSATAGGLPVAGGSPAVSVSVQAHSHTATARQIAAALLFDPGIFAPVASLADYILPVAPQIAREICGH